ncbi:hypothetical protein [Nocardioides yefusunii]|uniref:Uncharacterized protein n=1 Tax=Nocardioides yefusunii TaxID=2500546 RepID=A0ABW1QWU3_9ACTN|nr:hypothetical protein [Nocardioides yefusunii]
MNPLDEAPDHVLATSTGLDRRAMVRAGAWALPAISVAAASPSFASSPTVTDELHMLGLDVSSSTSHSGSVMSGGRIAFTYHVSGSYTDQGQSGAGLGTSFSTRTTASLGGSAGLRLSQDRRAMTGASAATLYGSRRIYTLNVTTTDPTKVRDLEFTVAGLQVTWSGSSSSPKYYRVMAVAPLTEGLLVSARGPGMYAVSASASTGVPAHSAATYSSTAQTEHGTNNYVTFTKPGPLTEVKFAVWNTVNADSQGYYDAHLGNIRVTRDL